MASTPRVPLGCDKRNESEKSWSVLEKVEQSGKWLQQACTTMFFIIPENVTSERPIALMSTLIRWWEALESTRSGEVAAEVSSGHWDATDGRNGGARQTVWEILMELERFNGKAKEEDQGALALVLDLAKAFEWVSLPCGVGLGDALQLPKEDLAGAVRILFEHQRRAQLEGCVVEPLQYHHGYPAWIQVGLLASAYCTATMSLE